MKLSSGIAALLTVAGIFILVNRKKANGNGIHPDTLPDPEPVPGGGAVPRMPGINPPAEVIRIPSSPDVSIGTQRLDHPLGGVAVEGIITIHCPVVADLVLNPGVDPLAWGMSNNRLIIDMQLVYGSESNKFGYEAFARQTWGPNQTTTAMQMKMGLMIPAGVTKTINYTYTIKAMSTQGDAKYWSPEYSYSGSVEVHT